jgi:hypothetical protein
MSLMWGMVTSVDREAMTPAHSWLGMILPLPAAKQAESGSKLPHGLPGKQSSQNLVAKPLISLVGAQGIEPWTSPV